jgi:outer membrane immunogenic protein
MKRLLLGLALAAAVSPAYAADLFVEEAPVVEVSDDLFDWTGLYVGLQAGYVNGTVETEDWFCVNNPDDCYGDAPDGSRYIADLDLSGFKGGAHVGYNQQFGTLVVGAESQINLGGGSGDGPFTFVPGDGGEVEISDDESATYDTLWEGSTRLKLGVALDRLMPYVTGGLAYGQADITAEREFDDGPHDFAYPDINLIGYTVGAGVAYAVTDEIVIRGEANYTDYGTTTAAGVDSNQDTHDIEVVGPKQISLEAGISFKF